MERTQDLFAPTSNQLTVLSFGAGQDSTVLLKMYLEDKLFRQKYAPNDFLVVMSDTGDEFPQTYKHVEQMQSECEKHGVEFVFITSDMGFHGGDWQSLRGFYRAKNTIGSSAFPKVCTDRLKINPIYKLLEQWLSQKYGVKCGDKKGIREFAAKHGKVKMILGIAAGEEKRMSDASTNPRRWYRESIETVYPLVELGMDRSACQKYLHQSNLYVIPSNCMSCPYRSWNI